MGKIKRSSKLGLRNANAGRLISSNLFDALAYRGKDQMLITTLEKLLERLG